MLGYTQRQIRQANRARSLYHIVGAPTVENFKKVLRQNIVTNCPITYKDANTAEAIFGPDVSALKGKTVRDRPLVVREDNIEIPAEIMRHGDKLTLCMDIIFINGAPMLTTIDKTVKFRGLVALKNRTANTMYKALGRVLRQYDIGGFKIENILCDQEFQTLMDEVKVILDIDMDYPQPGHTYPRPRGTTGSSASVFALPTTDCHSKRSQR